MLGEVLTANVSTPFMLFMVKGTSSLLDIIERSVTFDLQDLVSSQMRLILHFGLVFLVSVEQLEMAINLLHKEHSGFVLLDTIPHITALGNEIPSSSFTLSLIKFPQATIAAKHGQRIVLFVSLLSSAVTCLIFGTLMSLQQAITIRLLQGIFAGAVGVARGCVTVITDTSNEGRAYAILG